MVDTPLSGAALITASADNSSGNWTNANQRALIASTRNIVPVPISAAGTTQGTATAATEHTYIITVCAAGAGIVLTGIFHELINVTANACLIYPAGSAQIWSVASQANLAASAPVSIPSGGSARFHMTSPSQGYVI